MVHFSNEELAARRRAVAAELANRGLDGVLMFRQESMYYLTGYDTFGYVFFQCLYMSADGETMTLLTRLPDLRQARFTSVIRDIRVWLNREEVNPAEELKNILEEHGCRGKRLGIETSFVGGAMQSVGDDPEYQEAMATADAVGAGADATAGVIQRLVGRFLRQIV